VGLSRHDGKIRGRGLAPSESPTIQGKLITTYHHHNQKLEVGRYSRPSVRPMQAQSPDPGSLNFSNRDGQGLSWSKFCRLRATCNGWKPPWRMHCRLKKGEWQPNMNSNCVLAELQRFFVEQLRVHSACRGALKCSRESRMSGGSPRGLLFFGHLNIFTVTVTVTVGTPPRIISDAVTLIYTIRSARP
jgi:hypothetical protein